MDNQDEAVFISETDFNNTTLSKPLKDKENISSLCRNIWTGCVFVISYAICDHLSALLAVWNIRHHLSQCLTNREGK